MRIGLLGGSFNPAHEGHRSMSLYALKHLGLDQIWWLVSPQNPLKSSKAMARFDVRMTKARAVAAHPKIKVKDLEMIFGTRFTADTLDALKKHFPRVRFVWLMGADNLAQIPRWHRWPDIFKAMPVAVFRRAPYAAGRRKGKAAQRFDRFWRPARKSRMLVSMTPPAWLTLGNLLHRLSSTEIRNNPKDLPRG